MKLEFYFFLTFAENLIGDKYNAMGLVVSRNCEQTLSFFILTGKRSDGNADGHADIKSEDMSLGMY